MRAWMQGLGVVVLLTACAGDDGNDTDTDAGAEAYPSTFTEGKYRTTSLALREQDDGVDQDGDDTPDNNLPAALNAADPFLSELDLSPEGFDTQIATAIEAGDLIVLMDAAYAQGTLTVDLLSGAEDEGGTLSVDPISYDGGGAPLTRLLGGFDDQVVFAVTADTALLPVTFVPDEPPALVPLRNARIAGTVDAEGLEAMVTGIIPAEQLADDVLADLIPPEGIGDRSKEQLMATLRAFTQLEGVADIDLGDGQRAVSCAFDVSATPTSWED